MQTAVILPSLLVLHTSPAFVGPPATLVVLLAVSCKARVQVLMSGVSTGGVLGVICVWDEKVPLFPSEMDFINSISTHSKFTVFNSRLGVLEWDMNGTTFQSQSSLCAVTV